MIVYFAIYTFLGYLLESCYVSFFERKWVSSGLLKGPFIPLYGFGACLLIYLSPYLKDSLFLCFLLGGLAMTTLEYFSSLFIEKYFHTKCWNYTHHFLHFQGRICFFYYLMWSFLSVFFIYLIHPYIESLSLNNDTVCIFALIYLSFVSKALIERLQPHQTKGVHIH